MKSQVPRSIPWKFPAIGHRHDALVIKMSPIGITTAPARLWWRGTCRIARKPFLHDVVVELLSPKQPGQILPLNRALFFAQTRRCQLRVKLVGFRFARGKEDVEIGKRLSCPHLEPLPQGERGNGVAG